MATVFSKEDVNYVRLQILVGKIGTGALREYFDNSLIFGPTVLQGTLASKRIILQTLKTRGIVNASQWDLIYPPGGAVPTSHQFDLTLLVLLLRHFGALGEPRHFNWGQLPLPTDVAIYHEIARLKYHRNKYAHATSGINDADFLTDWKEIEGAILRIVPTTKKHQFIIEIKNLLTSPLNQEDLEKLLCAKVSNCSDEIKDKIRKHQSLTKKSTKTIVDNTKTCKDELEIKINKKTDALQTCIEKASEDQRLNTQNIIHQQTAALQTAITKALDDQSQQGGEPADRQLDAFARKLKRIYKEKFQKVQSVSRDGDPTTFDVTSKLYMDLDCTPLEMRCAFVGGTDKPVHKTNLKRHKEYPDDGIDTKRQKKSDTVSSQEPVPSTSYKNDISRKQDTRNIKINAGGMQGNKPIDMEDAQITQTDKLEHLEQENPTTTAHISRLFTPGDNPERLPILFEADAGVGKTTLFHRLALNWANDSEDMKQFKLVLLIPLRRVKSKEIEDIICDDLQLLKPVHKTDLKKCLDLWEDEILYLVDGLDEVKLDPENDLTKLMRDTGKHVFCSSRPILQVSKEKQNHHGMDKFILIKLLGFSDQTLKKYINQYFREIEGIRDNMADTVMAECSKHFYCKSLMKIPLYANLFCFLWGKYDTEFPETASQLFNKFLTEILNNYLIRYSHASTNCNINLHIMMSTEKVHFSKSPFEKTVPHQLRSILKRISALAYTTLIEHKVIFTVEDADECELSLADLTHIGMFTVEEDDGSLIYFRHKLFHEYFAGLYLTLHGVMIYTLFTDAREEIISRCHILQNAFFFAAGLCEDTYDRIIFALKYSHHHLEPSYYETSKDCKQCETCREMNDGEYYSVPYDFEKKHKKSCGRCHDLKNKLEHDFDVENMSDCDKCYAMATAMMYPESMKHRDLNPSFGDETDIQLLSFLVQLYFEHHTGEIYKQGLGWFSLLPVHCSSVHSLAAAMYALQMVQRNKINISVTLILIDGPVVDIDQLLCILNECNNNEHIECITLMKGGQTFITEILNMEWKYIKRVGFTECDILVPIATLIQSFPLLEMILYDVESWKNVTLQTNRKDNGKQLQDLAVIVKSYHNRRFGKTNLDSLEPCTMITSKNIGIIEKRVVTVCCNRIISDGWLSNTREECIPGSVIKGICDCGFRDDAEYGQDMSMDVVVNQYGIQWRHLMLGYNNCNLIDESPKIFRVDLDEYTLSLSDEVNLIDQFEQFMESAKETFEIDHLTLHHGGSILFDNILKVKWPGIKTIEIKNCEVVAPVDVLSEIFPDVEVVSYDEETLENGRPLQHAQNSVDPSEMTKLCLNFVVYECSCRWFHRSCDGRGMIAKCTLCVHKNYRHIDVALECYEFSYLSSQSFEYRHLLSSGENVKGLCWGIDATPFPCFQHIEYYHTSNTGTIGRVYEQNPGLKEVVLELTRDLQKGLSKKLYSVKELPGIQEVLAVLRKGGHQWQGPCFVFNCLCDFKVVYQGEENSIWSTCFKPFKIATDKVQAWRCDYFDRLNEEEQFVLQHHMSHESSTERGNWNSYVFSKEKVTSWMTEKDAQRLDGIDNYEPVMIEVKTIQRQSTYLKFARDSESII